jgi:hypothetical protein
MWFAEIRGRLTKTRSSRYGQSFAIRSDEVEVTRVNSTVIFEYSVNRSKKRMYETCLSSTTIVVQKVGVEKQRLR